MGTLRRIPNALSAIAAGIILGACSASGLAPAGTGGNSLTADQSPLSSSSSDSMHRGSPVRQKASSYSTVYQFGGKQGTPQYPEATLTNVKGILYGTTTEGGKYGAGTVYSFDPSTRKLKVLHNFGNGQDGWYPRAELLDYDGALYGTTEEGGANSVGTVFSTTPGGKEKVECALSASSGDQPITGLIAYRGTLYGTTQYYGEYNAGSIFDLGWHTAPCVGLFQFRGTSAMGAMPNKLLETGGRFYGTTDASVYTIDPDGSGYRTLYKFGSQGSGDAVAPQGNLTELNGAFYGVSSEGGTDNYGAVFKVSYDGAERIVYSFGGTRQDGAYPGAALINYNGRLIGTTFAGGTTTGGTVFSVSPHGSERTLHDFGEGKTDGYEPLSSVLNVNGTLYGTTLYGGKNGSGVIYALKL